MPFDHLPPILKKKNNKKQNKMVKFDAPPLTSRQPVTNAGGGKILLPQK